MPKVIHVDDGVHARVEGRHIIIGIEFAGDPDKAGPASQGHVHGVHPVDNTGYPGIPVKCVVNNHQVIDMVFHFIQCGPGINDSLRMKPHPADDVKRLFLVRIGPNAHKGICTVFSRELKKGSRRFSGRRLLICRLDMDFLSALGTFKCRVLVPGDFVIRNIEFCFTLSACHIHGLLFPFISVIYFQ
jgi:hypothetical protein